MRHNRQTVWLHGSRFGFFIPLSYSSRQMLHINPSGMLLELAAFLTISCCAVGWMLLISSDTMLATLSSVTCVIASLVTSSEWFSYKPIKRTGTRVAQKINMKSDTNRQQ